MHLPPFWQAFCLILAPFGIVLLGIFLIDFAQYLYINGKSWLYEHARQRYWAAKTKSQQTASTGAGTNAAK